MQSAPQHIGSELSPASQQGKSVVPVICAQGSISSLGAWLIAVLNLPGPARSHCVWLTRSVRSLALPL